MNHDIRDALCEMGMEEAVILDAPDFDDAIIGITEDGIVAYDYDEMIACMMRDDGVTAEEAIEWIDYNTIRALPYAGPKAPIIVHRLETGDR